MNVREHMLAVKARHNITSDYGLAKLLRVSPQAMSKYMAGSEIPGPLIAFRVADALEAPRDVVVAAFELERSEKAGRADQIAGWREWVQKLGGIAAAVIVGTVLSAPTAAPARINAQSATEPLNLMSISVGRAETSPQ